MESSAVSNKITNTTPFGELLILGRRDHSYTATTGA
jgi:hypothetical protein